MYNIIQKLQKLGLLIWHRSARNEEKQWWSTFSDSEKSRIDATQFEFQRKKLLN
jgi:hypothetical protein